MIDKIVNLYENFNTFASNIDKRYKRGKELSIKSLPKLDNFLWGIEKQKLVIVGARPSMGKSTLLMQMAYDFAESGKVVYFFSFEMTPQVCFNRLLSSQCEIDNKLIRTGEIVPEKAKYIDKIDKFKGNLKNVKMPVIGQLGMRFKELLQIVEGLDTKVDCVVIDYIQMVKSAGTSDKQAIDDYIKELRNLAVEKDFCILMGSQINRAIKDSKDRFPTIEMLKGSGTLEEHSDMIMLLHWEYHYGGGDKYQYWINIAKNRDGATGAFPNMYFYPQYYKICETPMEGEHNVYEPTESNFG